MKNIVSVLIVNYNSSDFVELNLYALSKLTKNKYQVFILDNNSKRKDYSHLKQIVSKYNNVFLEGNKTNLKGSLAHGTALNALVKKVSTPYFCILDADACWLRYNWDEILINKMTDAVKVIGAQYTPPKYTDFPAIFLAFFETKTFKYLPIDFRPKNPRLHLDTGYEMRSAYQLHGFKGQVLPIYNTRHYKKGPFKNLVVAEYYLKNDSQIFASHFSRGSSGGIPKYMNQSFFSRLPLIGYLISWQKGSYEKNQWLKTCREIINRQI